MTQLYGIKVKLSEIQEKICPEHGKIRKLLFYD